MKKIFLSASVFFILFSASAQWSTGTTSGTIYYTGKVGVGGLNNPSALLQVGSGEGDAGPAYSTSTLLKVYQPFNFTLPSASIDLGMCQPHARITGIGNTSDNGIGQMTLSTMKNGIVNEVMRLTSDGTVGIGTTAPDFQFKLAVEGKIGAREIKVTLDSWADHVFNADYQRMTLASLEAFIQKNKHLPNIPSAAEVKENKGVDLGEMNVKLLEKIEELTLYVIEVNKKVEKLEKENEALRNNK